MQVITSKENEIIKNIRKLKDKKYRDQQNEYVIEGIKIIKEAIIEKANIHLIVVCEDCIEENSIDQKTLYEIAKYKVVYVTKKIFETLTDVVSPQGVLAIIEKGQQEKNIDYTKDLIIVLDDIRDPGNLGSILRTIDSAGLGQIILSGNTVDIYNPKVVRSTMGAMFRLNIIETNDLIGKIKEIKKHKYKMVATSLETNESIYDLNFSKKVIVIGNEATGISKDILEIADIKAKIPMIGKTESLNASVATGIIVYEYVRQKLL